MPCPTCGTDWRTDLQRRFEDGRYHYTSRCARDHTIVDAGGPSDETPARAERRIAQRALIARIQTAHYGRREPWLKACELVDGVRDDLALAALDAHYAGRADDASLAMVIERGLCAALYVPEDVAFDVLTTSRWRPIDRDRARAQLHAMQARRADGEDVRPSGAPIEAQLFDELFAPDEVALYSNAAWLDELRAHVARDGLDACHIEIGDNAGMPVTIGHVLGWNSHAIVALDREVLAIAFEP
ncbi:MAG: hypothetical protein K8W52_25935 [Deltaproteobacteria bacterium]|nr:hypothetical protein [Deltaproteobacteria bacterium]